MVRLRWPRARSVFAAWNARRLNASPRSTRIHYRDHAVLIMPGLDELDIIDTRQRALKEIEQTAGDEAC